MSIGLPSDLPALESLRAEGVPLLGDGAGTAEHVRPVRVALLNLMPNKEETETQLARLLGATPFPVELTLLTTSSYRSKNVPASSMPSLGSSAMSERSRARSSISRVGPPPPSP